MHAARAGVAARLAPGSLSASSSRRLASARPLLWPRSFAIAAPSRAVLDTGSQSTPQEESLAGRLRQRRPSERTPASESPSADSQTLSADASTSQDAATAPAEKIQRPHKLRKPKAPADRTKKDEKGGVPPAAHTPSRREMRRKQAAAPIEGFRAKRFAMLKMRREQVQAMQEANGSEDWLTDDHTHVRSLVALPSAARTGPRLTRAHCTAAQEPVRARHRVLPPTAVAPPRQRPTAPVPRPPRPRRVPPATVVPARQARAAV